MATIVNTPTPGDQSGSSAGWAVAVIILLAVIAGIAFWYMRYGGASAQDGANIQIHLPTAGGSTGNGGAGAPAPGE